MSRIRWYQQDVERDVQRVMLRNMHLATNHLKEATRRALNLHKTRTEGPSRLGEIPHVDTGVLRDSIFRRVDQDTKGVFGDVGTKLIYGIHHEIAGRPFLRPTMRAEAATLARLLGGAGSGAVMDISTET